MNKKIVSLLIISFFLVFSANAALAVNDIKLTVGTGTASSGNAAAINITADPITGGTPTLAGAAFTIKYDSSLTVTVDNTTFFDTFLAQGYTAGQDGLDSNGLVDGTFDSPFVTNDTTESGMKLTRIAAARKDSATVSAGTVLFKLSVTGTVDGTYPIEIIPTVLDNSAAGWTGQASELLIDVDGDTYPVRLDKSDTANMVAGSVTVDGGTTTGPSVTVNESYSAGLNLVPFTASNTGVTTAAEWDAAITAANSGVTVSQIFGWDPVNQRYTGAYTNLGGGIVMGDFTLEPGVSYFVEVSGASTLTFSGNDYTSIQLYAGLNLISVPKGRTDLVNASDLDADIVSKTGVTVSQIFGWDETNQRYAGAYTNLGGGIVMGDFALAPDLDGFFVEVSADATYNPY